MPLHFRMELLPTPLQQRAHGYFFDDIKANTRDQELSFIYVDTEPFNFHASLPRLQLRDALLLGVRNEHQVINVDKLPWHTSAKLMRKRHQQQGEEQWYKDSALMHTKSLGNPFTVMTINAKYYTICQVLYKKPLLVFLISYVCIKNLCFSYWLKRWVCVIWQILRQGALRFNHWQSLTNLSSRLNSKSCILPQWSYPSDKVICLVPGA